MWWECFACQFEVYSGKVSNLVEKNLEETVVCTLYKRWVVASSQRSMGSPRPLPPASLILFYLVFCFLILPMWDDFCFYLHSSDPDCSASDSFPWILECLFFVFLLSIACVRVWGRSKRGIMRLQLWLIIGYNHLKRRGSFTPQNLNYQF